MTPAEIVDELLALPPQDAHVILEFLADHVYRADPPLLTPLDFQAWLRNLSYAALFVAQARSSPKLAPAEQRRW